VCARVCVWWLCVRVTPLLIDDRRTSNWPTGPIEQLSHRLGGWAPNQCICAARFIWFLSCIARVARERGKHSVVSHAICRATQQTTFRRSDAWPVTKRTRNISTRFCDANWSITRSPAERLYDRRSADIYVNRLAREFSRRRRCHRLLGNCWKRRRLCGFLTVGHIITTSS